MRNLTRDQVLRAVLLIGCCALGAGCESGTGAVDIEASKAAASRQGAGDPQPAEPPKEPIRNREKRPNIAPARTPSR